MTKIYLVRHAEAEGNLYRIAHGHYDSIITARGYRQIEALAKRFEGIHIDAVYSSDLFRPSTTARAVYVPKGLPLHKDPAFREVGLGVWEGQTWQELREKYPEQMEAFNHNIAKFSVPGSETGAGVRDRFITRLTELAKEYDGKTIAVFSHGAALRIVLGTLQGLTLAQTSTSAHGDNTAVSLVEYEDGAFRVVFRDDNSHLEKAGLSTFARQKWWKNHRMTEDDFDYLPMTQEDRLALGIPGEGEGVSVWQSGQLAGGVELLPEKDPGIGWVGWYGLLPPYRGQNRGIAPLGQAVQRYRAEGVEHICLRCEEEKTAEFFRHFGFYDRQPGVLELYIGYGERA